MKRVTVAKALDVLTKLGTDQMDAKRIELSDEIMERAAAPLWWMLELAK